MRSSTSLGLNGGTYAATLLLLLLLLAACASPDERVWLQGSVVDRDGGALEDAGVRLFRAASFDGIRCAPMAPLSTAATDVTGTFAFSLSRQQLTGGAGAPVPFRLETDAPLGGTVSFTFAMPAGDLTLPALTADDQLHRPPGFTAPALQSDEAFVDGWLAWRGATVESPTEDRAGVERTLLRIADFLLAVSDDLGTRSYVGVDYRVEGRPVPRYLSSGRAPVSRGASCVPGVDGDACPLTDGRYLPVILPKGTTELTFDFGVPRTPFSVTVRGLDAPGEPVRLVVDNAREADSPFDPFMSFPLDAARVQAAALSCDEPGVFATYALPSIGIPPSRRMRVSVLDAHGQRLAIRSVAEVSFE